MQEAAAGSDHSYPSAFAVQIGPKGLGQPAVGLRYSAGFSTSLNPHSSSPSVAQGWSLQGLANCIWGCARLKVMPPRVWMQGFEAATVLLLPQFSSKDLAQVLWAFGELRYPPSDAWMSEARLATFTPAEIWKTAAALSKLQRLLQHSSASSSSGVRSAVSDGGSGVGDCSKSVKRSRRQPSSLRLPASWCRAYLTAATAAVPQLSAANLVAVAAAVHHLQLGAQVAGLGFMSGPVVLERHRLLAAVVKEVVARASRREPPASRTTLAFNKQSTASCSCDMDTNTTSSSSCSRLRKGSPAAGEPVLGVQHIGQLAWSFHKCSFQVHPDQQRILLEHVLACCSAGSSNDVAFRRHAASAGDNVEMTVSIVLKVEGGSARMDLWYPGAPADQAPSQSSHDLAVSQASAESFLTIAPDTLLATPGQYVLRVEVTSGTPVNGWLRVDTPGRDLQLNKFDHGIMVQMAQSCCQGNPADSPFCSVIAPRSLYQTHSWTRDLCHFGPSSCNAAGQLTRLILPDLGLNCPVFPAMLGKLPALRRLDLSQNVLGKSDVDQVAQALLGAPDLVELALASTGLSGELSCLFLDLKNLKVLDLSFNLIEGPIPGCLLNALTELYLTGNDISGTLAGWHSGSQLTTFFANAQRGKGLLGSFPGSFVLLRNLQYLNLAGNSLAGQLPGLPPNLRLFNISDNNINGQIGALPLSMWIYDARNNRLTGGLPLLSMFNDLEVFAASGNQLQGGIMALGASLRQLELANCGLSGPLPVLPASLKRLDLSDNAFSGDIASWDGSSVEMLRLANNQLGGPLPAFVSASSNLILLDLHGNRFSGPLPATWASANLQMMMLENNTLTGALPPSMAALPNLVVLRLAGNKLNGSLSEFAAALPRPANLTAGTTGAAFSKMFDLDLSWNQLSGTVSESIAALGLFNPNVTILLPSAGQSIAQVPRRLDLSGNKLTGPWPTWLLTEVPGLIVRCSCLVSVRLAGAAVSQLECPEHEILLTDYQWQVALEQRYYCWDGHTQQLMIDYLSSPAHSLQAPGPSSISTTTNTTILSGRVSDASGVNGAAGSNLQPDRSSILGQWAEPSGGGDSAGSTQKKGKGRPGGGVIAGAVIGSILGAALLGLAAYYLVYDHMLRQYKADIFHKYLVFGGGGARCFGYAGALHALRQLGLLGDLKGISGSSGGAVYALLAALNFSVSEVQAAMGTLPETENLSWLRLNSRLGLSDGEATFRQIEAAISAKLGVAQPTLADVAAASGCSITLAATSLARRAPVYLSSSSHPDMPVRDALRASCAIPFFFTPLKGPEGDLLVDGCISDCTPLAGLAAAGTAWEPSKTLVLAVHDAAGLEAPDFQGLLTGLIATCMQAGFHHTAAAGIDLLNLWPAVASVNPLQFRMAADQARDVIAASQALAEQFAVKKMRQGCTTATVIPMCSMHFKKEEVLLGAGQTVALAKMCWRVGRKTGRWRIWSFSWG
eukprot:gene4430-4685_t